MRPGIDWISTVVIVVAYVVGQMRTVSGRNRYWVWCVALGIVTLFRLRLGLNGFNGVVTAVAAGLCLYNGYRAVRTPGR